jgi:hypothetical protein
MTAPHELESNESPFLEGEGERQEILGALIDVKERPAVLKEKPLKSSRLKLGEARPEEERPGEVMTLLQKV